MEEYKTMNYYQCLGVVICLSIIGNSDARKGSFLGCMSVKNSSCVHSPASSSYSSLLQSAQQNPRWLNSTSASKPSFIVTPNTLVEIQAAVVCTRKHGMQVRVKSGGHDYEGQSFLCSNSPFIIIALDYFRSVSVDVEGRTAWVQSGSTLGELYYRIAEKSGGHLGFPAGLYPSVGVGGHLSGGGIGTMMRKHGLAADNVVDARLVDVNGRILDRKTMGEDVFWAIRGGGGASFGVVTAWKIRLVRVPPLVTVFSISVNPERGIKLIHRWQFIAAKLPKDLFIRTVIQKIDSKSPIQVLFESLFLGRKNELIPLMNRRFPELKLREEDCTELSWIESVMFFSGYRKGEPLEVLVKWGEEREGEASLEWIRMLHEFMKPYVSSSPRAAYINYRDLDL